ncbi:GLE1-like protein-domain-containing protein [Obelidium mucronatum]|nr:GLE1-like protein-domain-containing protein [Obelidium mucronatum]
MKIEAPCDDSPLAARRPPPPRPSSDRAFAAAVKQTKALRPPPVFALSAIEAHFDRVDFDHCAAASRGGAGDGAIGALREQEAAAKDRERRRAKEELIEAVKAQNDGLMAFLDQKLKQLRIEAETKTRELERIKTEKETAEKERAEKDRAKAELQEQLRLQQAAERDAKNKAAAAATAAAATAAAAEVKPPPLPLAPLQTQPAPGPPPPQQPLAVVARVSNIPRNIITSEEAWESASKFLGLIQELKDVVKPTIIDSAFPTFQAHKRKIKTTVGQVTRSRAKIFYVASTIHKILQDASKISPNYYRVLLDITAKALALQSDAELSVHPVKAPALAQATTLIIEKHPDILVILLGRLMKRCPYIVPMYFKKAEGETLDEFNKRRRFKKSDDEWETEERYNERMCGMVRFYAGITQIKTNTHMYEIDFGWQWMARVLNINPRKITPQLICSFLQIAGHSLLETYKSQAVKLFVYLYKVFLPKMMTLSVPSAMKLQIFLEEDDNFVKTGKMPLLKGCELEP